MARQRRPICPTCGRPIAKLPKGQGPNVSRMYRLDTTTATQNALDSGSYVRPSVHHTADGRTSEYGTLGDNVFCGAGCGWLMAVRLVRAIGISDVFRMLPPYYNPEVFAIRERDKRRAKSRERYKRDKELRERTQDRLNAERRVNLDQDQGP